MKNKLFFFITDITTTGGTERALITLANQLARLNYEITIYSLYKKNTDLYFELDKRINVFYIRANNKLLKLLEIKNISKAHPDTVKIVISMGRLSVEISIIFKIFNLKKLYLAEHTSFSSYNPIVKKLKIFSYKTAERVIVLTRYDKNILENNFNLNNISHIENINSYENYAYEPNYSSRDKIVIAVGRFCYAKNFQRLLNIWYKAETNGWSLLIIGDGPEKEKLKSMIEDLNLKNVNLIPFTKDIQDYYMKARLYVMTSRYEGLPMVLIESQYFSIPSISLDCKTGPSEIIDNEKNGYLIDYNNDSEFIEKLNHFFNDEKIQNVFSLNAFNNSEKYSSVIILKKWHSLLRKR